MMVVQNSCEVNSENAHICSASCECDSTRQNGLITLLLFEEYNAFENEQFEKQFREG